MSYSRGLNLLKVWILVITNSIAQSVSAVSVDSKMNNQITDQSQVVDEIRNTKDAITNADQKRRQILSDLFQTNLKIKKLVVEKSELDQQKMFLENQIKNLARATTELDVKIRNQKNSLRKRLLAIYKLGGLNILRIVASSSSGVELERNLKILKNISKSDLNLIRSYNYNQQELLVQKETLNKRWLRFQKLTADLNLKESKLSQDQNRRSSILGGIKKSQDFAQIKLKSLRERSKMVQSDEEGLLDSILIPSFVERKRDLFQPVDGPLKRGFGFYKHPYFNLEFNHKGHFYSATEGMPVRAVYLGRVAYAGEIPGFGFSAIIDHGDHYYSVYSQLKDFQVKQGEDVKPGQTIANVGPSNGENEEGLYFEIRHFSEPMDPKLWMKGNTQ